MSAWIVATGFNLAGVPPLPSLPSKPPPTPAPVIAPTPAAPDRPTPWPPLADTATAPADPQPAAVPSPVAPASPAPPPATTAPLRGQRPAPPAKAALPPAPRSAPEAAAETDTSAAGPTIQVGAFASEALSDAAWSEMSRIWPEKTAGKRHANQTLERNGRTIYRSHVSGFATRAEAQAFCGALRASGRDCFLK